MNQPVPSIVVVDDNPASQSLYRRSADALDCELLTFSSSEDSLAYLREHCAALLIIDVLVRGTDGLTLLGRVREIAHHRDTPVVMVTSKDYQQDRRVAAALGAAEYLLKPLRSQEIGELIRRHGGVEPRAAAR